MNLDRKVALVTGGGAGIGRAIALLLAEKGADVAVNYSRSQEAAELTAGEIEKLGRKSMAVQADVADDGAVRRMVAAVADTLGGLHILINNAGYTRQIKMNDLEAVDDEAWERTMAVNVKGPFQCARAAAPHMQEAGAGVIVNISSLAGALGQGSSLPYCASKAALNRVTRLLARILAPTIRVNAVAPGVVDTRWVEGMTGFVRSAQMQTPMRRIAQPHDVAQVVVSLVTAAEFVTGQIVNVDGGLSA